MQAPEQAVKWLVLSQISKPGKTSALLVDFFRDPEIILGPELKELLEVPGLDRRISSRIRRSGKEVYDEAMQELEKLQASGIGLTWPGREDYPPLLDKIYDPPLILYYRGDPAICTRDCIAIVGSRMASSYGRSVARKLAACLAESGFTVISGLARGIDTEAHLGALETGKTCAVFGTGVDRIYPHENSKLAERISRQGVIFSEFPSGTGPKRYNFPQRNRIISGIARGTVIIEAAKRSGSLITASFAMEQGREVFAVPGEIGTMGSEGTNNLIKQGARLVSRVDDILETLSFQKLEHIDTVHSPQETEQDSGLSEQEAALLDQIGPEPRHVDDLFGSVEGEIGRIQSALLSLELKGFIEQVPGKRFKRT